MNKHNLIGFLAVLALATGCGGKPKADVTFFWTFWGDTCSAAGVSAVQIVVQGEALANNGYYDCLNGGQPGITLHDFRAKTYSYTIEGLNSSDQPIYRASGTFAMDGVDITLDVDLTPLGEPTSFAYLSWNFPSNWASTAPSCADATVSYIDVAYDYDETNWDRYDCTAGKDPNDAFSRLLAPGTHPIRAVAVFDDGLGNTYDVGDYTGSVTTTAYQPTSQTFTIPWTIGGTNIGWQLKTGGTNQTCASAGVTDVYIQFTRVSDGTLVYPENSGRGNRIACDSVSASYFYLRSGQYDVTVSATGTAGNYSTAAPVRVTITSGQWPGNATPDIVVVSVH